MLRSSPMSQSSRTHPPAFYLPQVFAFITNAHVTHVISLATAAVRQLIVGLLDALDIASLDADDPAAGTGPGEP